MPFGHLIPEIDPRSEDFRQRLLREWSGETQESSGPVIVETTDALRPQQAPTHLYVFWDAWRDLSQRERSEIIMDVYEDVRGLAYARNVTIAMGLTLEEADRMKLRYTTKGVVA